MVNWAHMHNQSPGAVVYMGFLMHTAFQEPAADWPAEPPAPAHRVNLIREPPTWKFNK